MPGGLPVVEPAIPVWIVHPCFYGFRKPGNHELERGFYALAELFIGFLPACSRGQVLYRPKLATQRWCQAICSSTVTASSAATGASVRATGGRWPCGTPSSK